MTESLPKPLPPDKPWCRLIVPLVDLDPDEKPICHCEEKAYFVVGFGQGNGEGERKPRLVCDDHAGVFCQSWHLRCPSGLNFGIREGR